ncbi:MAG: hypothetical protein R2793_01350 [Flavobacteriaceae bacterium]
MMITFSKERKAMFRYISITKQEQEVKGASPMELLLMAVGV